MGLSQRIWPCAKTMNNAVIRKKQKFLYRTSNQTLESRELKKMAEKVTWFRGWDNKKKPPEKYKNERRGKNIKSEIEYNNNGMETRTVLFVDHTPGSTLAKRLKREEEKLADTTGYKGENVEKGGDQF